MNNRIKSTSVYFILILLGAISVTAFSSDENKTVSKTTSIVAERKALLDSI